MPTQTKYKYNVVTHKMDDDSKPEIEDSIEAIEELTEETYRITKTQKK